MAPLIARLQHALIALTPFLTGVALILLSLLPFGLSGGLFVSPLLALMPIYFWTLYRPQLMPAPAVFGLGLVQDLVSGGPIGLWPFILLVTFGILSSQRLLLVILLQGRLGFGFAFVMGVAMVTAWATGCIVYARFLDPTPFLLQAVLSIALYPVIGRLLVALHSRIRREFA